VSALGIWSDPADDAAAIAWARDSSAALEPFSLKGGGYLNHAADDETARRVEQAYGDATFARLRTVKRRLDPDNRFASTPTSRPPEADRPHEPDHLRSGPMLSR